MMRNLHYYAAIALGCLVVAAIASAQHKPDAQGTGQHLDHRFDDAEKWAKEFDDPARNAWQMPDRVIDALGIKAGESVADIGAGTGYFAIRLAKTPSKPMVYAVDVEQSMLDHIRKRAAHEGLTNVVTVLAGPDRTNLQQPVDAVLIVDTYHHIPNRPAYFSALKEKMKPGARLAIVDFRKDAPSGPPKEFRFTPEQISSELARAGFRLQATHDFLRRQIFLVYTAR
jgi:cyclopropane fatty-acyl-phospholipid synthase-like methyltransferase